MALPAHRSAGAEGRGGDAGGDGDTESTEVKVALRGAVVGQGDAATQRPPRA